MIFITLEGVDGAGKSTQATLLSNIFKRLGLEHIITREPGGCFESEAIRQIFCNETLNFSNDTKILLMTAARIEHVRKKILPALENNIIVICDRFIDSTVIYQAYALGFGHMDIRKLHKEYVGDIYPDITFVFNIATEEANSRILLRKNNDYHDLELLEKIISGYEKIQKTAERFVAIDASKSSEVITLEMVKELKIRFPEVFTKKKLNEVGIICDE